MTRATSADISQRDLNRIRGELQKLIDNDQSEGYEGMSIHAEVMKLRRAVTLAETQSVESLRRYFERQRNAARSSGASKASQRFVSEAKVRDAMERTEGFDDLHPKFRRARILLAQTLGIEDGERVIVFTESRDTAEALTDFLGEHFQTRKFVGQGDKEGSDGMTQNEQQETLDEFRAGEFEVLVSTSVAEEGLDVPEVDLVLFYEPVPTASVSSRVSQPSRVERSRAIDESSSRWSITTSVSSSVSAAAVATTPVSSDPSASSVPVASTGPSSVATSSDAANAARPD